MEPFRREQGHLGIVRDLSRISWIILDAGLPKLPEDFRRAIEFDGRPELQKRVQTIGAGTCQRRFKTDTLFAENADLNLIHPHYICMPAMRPEQRPA